MRASWSGGADVSFWDRDGMEAVTLNNFCKLQDMGADDEDDILSCVHFLMVDVMSARRLVRVAAMLAAAGALAVVAGAAHGALDPLNDLFAVGQGTLHEHVQYNAVRSQ